MGYFTAVISNRKEYDMFTRFALTIATIAFASTAGAEERDIYSALNKVVESQSGAEIAQGLVEVGNTLTTMNVDQTIAFRTSLTLLIASGQVQKNTAERAMVNTLGQATGRHLRSLCSIDRSLQTVSRVNIELGRPFPCQIE
ncbi:MAG: hypothetical protein ACI9H6_000687 [Patiriisocius sp.]|jgi:hypothetical protein